METKELLIQLEERLKAGQTKEVLSHLHQINKVKLPRADRLPLAELARRSGAPELAIQFLYVVIHPREISGDNSRSEATADEYISYASSLRALGFLKEAREVLEKISEEDHPIVLLQKALVLFAEWKYPESIRPLKKFVKSKKISDYQRVIGEVNLLSAYISSENYQQALDLGQNLLKKTEEKGYLLLHGNSLELMSQYFIFTGQYIEAKAYLDQAENALKDFDGIYLLYVKKWKLILQLISKRFESTFDQDFSNLAKLSHEKHHSEILRDLEFFKALSENNTSKITQVLAGTPMKSYHQRAERQIKGSIKIPNRFVLNAQDSQVFDCRDRFFLSRPLLRKVLWLLSRDFYKSISVGQIFSVIYPDEYFNPETSLKRVDNLVYRLNQFFKSKQLPLFIGRSQYSYQLSGVDKMVIYRRSISTLEIAMVLLKKELTRPTFNRKELQDVLDISSASAKRLLSLGLRAKRIKLVNSGPQAKYCFSNFR